MRPGNEVDAYLQRIYWNRNISTELAVVFSDKKFVSGFPLDGAIYANPLIPTSCIWIPTYDKSKTATPPSHHEQDLTTMHQRLKSTANWIDCVQHAQSCKQLRLEAEWEILRNGLFPK